MINTYLTDDKLVRLKKLFRTCRRLASIWANGVTIKSSPPWLKFYIQNVINFILQIQNDLFCRKIIVEQFTVKAYIKLSFLLDDNYKCIVNAKCNCLWSTSKTYLHNHSIVLKNIGTHFNSLSMQLKKYTNCRNWRAEMW